MNKSFFTAFLALFLIMTQPAYAYLDPGTGSFILQMLIAGVMGVLFTIKLYWYKIKAFVAGLMGKEIENPYEDIDSEEQENDTGDDSPEKKT